MSPAFDKCLFAFGLVCIVLFAIAWAYQPAFPPLSAPLNWNTSR
jgi:hypothetical protein